MTDVYEDRDDVFNQRDNALLALAGLMGTVERHVPGEAQTWQDFEVIERAADILSSYGYFPKAGIWELT